MRETLKYINHMNEVIEFGSGDYYVNENDLRDFAWNVTAKNERISAFNRGVVTKTIPVVIATTEDGMALRNRLFEVCEKDVLAQKYGRLIIGDYYMKCYVTQSKKKKYLSSESMMQVALQITTDAPYWVKETVDTFGYGDGGQAGTNLDYNRDYPSDYTSNLLGKELVNANFVASNFRIVIYGRCEYPSITIAGHEYAVDVSLEDNEYLTIDSIEKTIVLTRKNGTKENCFRLRNKESYIFEKIPSGKSNVSIVGDFKFDIVLLEERSEPKWT